MKAVRKSSRTGQATVEQVCNSMHLKRDAYYKHRRRHSQRESVESHVIRMVKKEREIQPRVGTRKLHKELHGTFQESALKVGRDRLFDILRGNGMLVKRKKASLKPLILITIFTSTTTWLKAWK